MEVVARSAPDGYTLYICGIGQSIRPAMHKKLPFDTLRDFTRIWLYGAVPNVLVVHPSVPARSVVESGYPGFEVTVWYGLCGPARLPGTVIATLLAGIGKTLRLPTCGDGSPLRASSRARWAEATSTRSSRTKLRAGRRS